MLGRVPLALFEFWEILDDALHVFDGVELGLTLLGLQKLLNHIMNRVCHVTKV